MKQLKLYDYNADNFIKGRFITYSPRRVRRHLRRTFGFATYWKIRKHLIIKEVKMGE